MAEKTPVKEASSFRQEIHKKDMDTSTVTYRQTYFGLPVWDAAVNIVMHEEDGKVFSSSTTAFHDIQVNDLTDAQIAKASTPLKAEELRKLLGVKDKEEIKTNSEKLVVYKYDASKRVLEPHDDHNPSGFVDFHPSLPLPATAAKIKDGNFYVVRNVKFSMPIAGFGPMNWIALIEIESGSVLMLRALVDGVTGYVFLTDPITKTGLVADAPSATAAVLDPLRDLVTLPGLVAPVAGVQHLTGNFVTLTDVELPSVAAPTKPANVSFQYGTRTNDFAGVNTYYQCDRFFRYVESLGFNIASYFSGTTFPVPVDHRGFGGNGNFINAHCLGNGGGNGIGSVDFALADLTNTANPLGISSDWRVVLHELGGHGILWGHAHSPNFGFAHSAGDSIAAILNDPGSKVPDRFLTFPWVNIGRRHDRTPAAGWGWGGNIARNPFVGGIDNGGYNNEQILSSTLFRLYQSLGGDAMQNGQPNVVQRQFAANFTTYLILRAVGLVTPGATPNALSFEQLLETADVSNWVSPLYGTTFAGGAYYKTIRWAFEKQGLFQPGGAVYPNNNVGVAPPVDVYINDGRNGEYQYQPNWWSCGDIWNRLAADGGATHQNPVVGHTNYAYVRIKNRGSQPATNVVVKGFHCLPGVGLTYPNDWIPMATPQLNAPNIAANNNVGIVVGPFQWVPSQVGHECMFFSVSATGDKSNIDGRVTGPIPEWRLVPYDNNLAQRNVTPVSSGAVLHLGDILAKLPFIVRNPFSKAAKITLVHTLPAVLRDAKWDLRYVSAGAGEFSLHPGEQKEVKMSIMPGKELSAKVLATIKQPAPIVVSAYADGILIGGMTFSIDPDMK
jgi:hypothetical protein